MHGAAKVVWSRALGGDGRWAAVGEAKHHTPATLLPEFGRLHPRFTEETLLPPSPTVPVRHSSSFGCALLHKWYVFCLLGVLPAVSKSILRADMFLFARVGSSDVLQGGTWDSETTALLLSPQHQPCFCWRRTKDNVCDCDCDCDCSSRAYVPLHALCLSMSGVGIVWLSRRLASSALALVTGTCPAGRQPPSPFSRLRKDLPRWPPAPLP